MFATIIRRMFEIVQQILVPVFLVIIYIVGFGLTAIYVWIFHRRLVSSPRKDAETYWVKAEGYVSDEKEFESQS